MSGLLSVALIIFTYALFSRYLVRWAVTAPMIFLFVGWLIGDDGMGVLDLTLETEGVRLLAEATLVVVLFADATRIDTGILRSQFRMPGRLLGVGLPLTIVFGGLVAAWLIPEITTAEGLLIGAILAPTDAALGKAVITDKRVPVRVRQVLNVESGLNDGIALPVVTALVAVAAASAELETPAHWVRFAVREIGLGIGLGVVIGAVGGWLIHQVWERGWITGAARQLATLSIAVIAFTTTELDAIAGNGFIAAFVAGIAFGVATRMMHETAADLTEDVGELATWMTFLFFGIELVSPAVSAVSWQRLVYVALSLTVVRMLPVAAALVGTHCAKSTALFLGWFGPRGLASILFALLILDEADLAHREVILEVVSLTVLASVFLHGLSAKKGAELYAADVAAMPATMPELQPADEMPEPRRGGFFDRLHNGN